MSDAGAPQPSDPDAGGPVLLFDGVCNLCCASVRFVVKRDPRARVRFASLQSEAGRALLATAGLPDDALDSVVLVEDGRAYVRSTAVLRVARHLRAPWPLLRVLAIVPRGLRDWIYDRVARHRYRLFGKRETCLVPTQELARRFL